MLIDPVSALSALLIIYALYIYTRVNSSITSSIVLLLFTSLAFFLFVIHSIAYYFTGTGIDEATLYHIKYGLDGAGIFEFSEIIIVTAITFISCFVFLLMLMEKARKTTTIQQRHKYYPHFLLIVSLLINPVSMTVYSLTETQTNVLLSLPIFNEINLESEQAFHSYYREPTHTRELSNKKNIIFIYAESLERTYFNESVFPNLIRGLRELEDISTHFTNIRQVTHTGWTVAGMTASQCGVPLFSPSHGNSMHGMDSFLSSAYCLGDYLSEVGYELAYMGGASTKFAGKGKLYESHGFNEVLGRDELLHIAPDPTYRTHWGLYDDTLFELLYDKYVSLSEKDIPFGLFTLTLDTHMPYGHPSESCDSIKYDDGFNKILNAVACSDYLITQFVKKVMSSPYSDETLIVIMSDHLAMRNSASHILNKLERSNLFMIIDPSSREEKQINVTGSTLDVGATLLHYLGHSEGLGLGRNLLHENLNTHEIASIQSSLLNWSRPIQKMWEFPKITSEISIHADDMIMHIDERKFHLPALVELDDSLQTILKFQFERENGEKTLVHHRMLLERDKYFILVDACEELRRIDAELESGGLCMVSGSSSLNNFSTKLEQTATYKISDIIDITGMRSDTH